MLNFMESRRIDLNYRYLHGDLYELMKNAGGAVADAVSDLFGRGLKILVLCGTGNNGGDGLVAARLLSGDNEVSVFLASDENSIKTREAKKAFREYRGKLLRSFPDNISDYDVVIDAILGSGISGEPRKPMDQYIQAVNTSAKHLVSIDVPSGIGSEICISPEITVTFTDIKEGMTQNNSGRIIIKDIGIPDRAFRNSGPGDFLYLKKPDLSSHKGMNGRVLMITGHRFYGSAVIAAMGAVKSGSDTVKVFTSSENRAVISGFDPQIITGISKDLTPEMVQRSDSILIGSGCGDYDLSSEISALKGYTGFIVLDADALSRAEEIFEAAPMSRICMTPHATEFSRISGRAPTIEYVLEYCEKTGFLVILKGEKDIISDGRIYRITEGGNPRMTMGGTGDLLAGILTSLLNSSRSVLAAACMASFINKKSADLCFQEKSYWYDINDMISRIPEVLRYYSQYS